MAFREVFVLNKKSERKCRSVGNKEAERLACA